MDVDVCVIAASTAAIGKFIHMRPPNGNKRYSRSQVIFFSFFLLEMIFKEAICGYLG